MSRWWEDKVERVAPDVWRITMPLPKIALPAVNVYALSLPDGGLMLVDSGWSPHPESRGRLASALGTLGLGLADVRGFLITHLHRDHFTYAVEHRREFGSWIALGAGERASLAAFARFDDRPHDVDRARLREAGAADLARTIPVEPVDPGIWEEPDRWIAAGDRFAWRRGELRAVPTPGHTRGHFVFLDVANELAFTGDHILPAITPTVGSEPAPSGHALDDYLESLADRGRLPDVRILPAHGPIANGLHARSDELLAHHDQRLRDCLAVVLASDRRRTAAEVANVIRWTKNHLTVSELAPDDQMRAIFETAVHLDSLARAGKVRRTTLADVAYFEANRIGAAAAQ
jgi:glyoxylase-like metal-dependent hydrolase (beta-lactamase superfamily II)